MTGSLIKQENQEFEKLYTLNKRLLESLSKDDKKPQAHSEYGVYSSELKQRHKDSIKQRIEELEKSMKRREEVDWQPAHLLLNRFGLRDPHENRKVKPPMYFKPSASKKEGVEFETKETMQQMPGSTMAYGEDASGDEFFKKIQD